MEKMTHKLVIERKKQWEEIKRGDEITSKTLRAVHNTWCKLVNSQITSCPKCKKTRSDLFQLAYEKYTLCRHQGCTRYLEGYL